MRLDFSYCAWIYSNAPRFRILRLDFH